MSTTPQQQQPQFVQELPQRQRDNRAPFIPNYILSRFLGIRPDVGTSWVPERIDSPVFTHLESIFVHPAVAPTEENYIHSNLSQMAMLLVALDLQLPDNNTPPILNQSQNQIQTMILDLPDRSRPMSFHENDPPRA